MMKVPYSYLPRQFSDPDPILNKIRNLITSGQLTLGKPVEQFEESFASFVNARYGIGVGSGTDALFLSLKALGIGEGDEVITAVNTFVATAGAIETTGAKTVFVDCDDRYVIDPVKLEQAITPKTKAIIPVHYTGQPIDFAALESLSQAYKIPVVEDACTAIDGGRGTIRSGSFGITAAFSFHPLKNLNVWGDGGMITTNSIEIRDKLKLLRNHGMVDRDTYAFYAYNSRLDTIQAMIGSCLIGEVPEITDRRIQVAEKYDNAFRDLPQIKIPRRISDERHVYHMYMIIVEQRDALLDHLRRAGISAKIHYPKPLHLQPASRHLGYQPGDFPVAESQAKTIVSLPVHQYLTHQEIDYVIEQVLRFYRG